MFNDCADPRLLWCEDPSDHEGKLGSIKKCINPLKYPDWLLRHGDRISALGVSEGIVKALRAGAISEPEVQQKRLADHVVDIFEFPSLTELVPCPNLVCKLSEDDKIAKQKNGEPCPKAGGDSIVRKMRRRRRPSCGRGPPIFRSALSRSRPFAPRVAHPPSSSPPRLQCACNLCVVPRGYCRNVHLPEATWGFLRRDGWHSNPAGNKCSSPIADSTVVMGPL